MSSKYRRKQLKRQKAGGKKVPLTFKDEWQAMLFLTDYGVEADYQGEVYIPHDHLSRDALQAVDFLVSLGYIPTAMEYRPTAPVSSEYLKDGYDADQPEDH